MLHTKPIHFKTAPYNCLRKLFELLLIRYSRFAAYFLLAASICSAAHGGTPAFPEAEGFGANASGGRGGQVIYVENLNDTGPGSLRAAIDARGPRTVVFRVGGTILLETSLEIFNPKITIAGQTAPGDGITLRLGETEVGAAMFVQAADVIIRHIRIRVGPASVSTGECCRDAITFFDGADRVIVDHVSMSWGTDENLNAWGTAKNISVQRSVISEALLFSSHTDENGQKLPHSKGVLFGDQVTRMSLHHNLLAHNNQRNPLINANIGAKYEHVNNVIYNYGDFASVFDGRGSDPLIVNHIGNLYLDGANSRLNRWEVGIQAASLVKLYVKNNIGPHRPTDDLDEFAIVGSNTNFVEPASKSFQSTTPFSMSSFPITVQPVDSLLNDLSKDVGATLPRRDAIDQRVIDDALNSTGEIINDPSDVGGWINSVGGTPYRDSDLDGMPNAWERSNGLNPNLEDDRNFDPDGDGYTNLEEFLNNTDPRLSDAGQVSQNQDFCLPIKGANTRVAVVCL